MDTRSYVEIEYPHVAKTLVDNWNTPSVIRTYLDEVFTDARGERNGFTPAIFDELMFLRDLLWQKRHPDSERSDIYMDAFRNAVNPDREPRF